MHVELTDEFIERLRRYLDDRAALAAADDADEAYSPDRWEDLDDEAVGIVFELAEIIEL